MAGPTAPPAAPLRMPRVLHLHGSLAAGNPQAERCVRMIEAFGGRLRHTMVAADGDYSALAGITKGISVERKPDFPAFTGLPLPGRLQAIARAMVDHHLVLTYGRAGIGGALAHTAFGEVHSLPPLIHHEDGSDETAAQRRTLRSIWLRRVGLGRSAGLVVPSETMEAAALEAWQQPMGRVKLIADGVDLGRFAGPARSAAIGRLLKRDGELWLGCFVRGTDPVRVEALVRDLARFADSWHLVLVGEPVQRAGIESLASGLALDHRVHFVGEVSDRAAAIALFDVLVMAGGPEPLPLVAIEAMAAGKPVVGLDPGEAHSASAADNCELAGGLEQLVEDGSLRQRIGEANRERATAERSEAAMVATYRRLYASAMGVKTI